MLQIYTRTQTKRVYLYVIIENKKKKKKKEKSFTAICLLFQPSEFMKVNMSILFIHTQTFMIMVLQRDDNNVDREKDINIYIYI